MPTLPRRLGRNLVLLALGTGLMSCDECGEPGEPAIEPSYELTVRPDHLFLTGGGSGTSALEMVRHGRFYGVISIRVEAPPGIVATPTATSIPWGMVGGVDIIVSVPVSTPRGDYPVRVIGSASGLAERCDTLEVSVSEPSPGGFTLKLAPTTMTLLPGDGDEAVVSINREPPFDGTVQLAVTGMPSGVSARFWLWDEILPDSVRSSLHVNTTAHAEQGTWPLTITGSATRVPSQSAVLTLTVLPLPYGFSLGVNPDTLAVPQLGRGTTTVKVARVTGFDGEIALYSSDVFPGLVTSFAPDTIPGGAASARLDVDVRFHVPTGVYPVPIRGAAAGVAAGTDTLVLVVTPGCFTMAVDEPRNDTLTVRPGQRDSVALLITRALDFSGDISLTFTGAPPGVSVSASSVPVDPGYGTARLLIDVGIATAPGTYPLTVRGTGGGCSDATATVLLVIPAVGRITISTTSDVALRQGGTALVPLGIGRIAPFDGEVTLTAEGLPPGITAVFAPATLSPDRTTSTLTYTALASVPVGTYQVTIRATGSGVPSTTITQFLLVSPP